MIPQRLEFYSICTKNNLKVTDSQIGQISQYVDLLLEWNKKINLISRKDEENVWTSHILHSAAILFLTKLPPGARVLDLGTGGGLPGLVLKILQPDLQLYLLDGTNKKVKVVQEMISTLGLNGIDAVWGRAEEQSSSKLAGTFDVVVARAVAALPDLITWARPFLKAADGESKNDYLFSPSVVALKGGEMESEVKKAQSLKFVREIKIQPLLFSGSQQLGGVDKKILTITFRGSRV